MPQKAPQHQQAQADLKIPLYQHITSRDGTMSKDAKLVNCFGEPSTSGVAVVKRPGTVDVRATTSSGTSQGLCLCNGVAWAIQNDTLYNVSTGATIAIPTVTVAGQPFDVLSDVPYGKTLLKSASGLWIFDGTTCTKVVDANYPATTVPGISELDGTYYVMASDGTIRGSAIQDPTTWPALSFIGGDAILGRGTGMTRHLNYLIAFYEGGMQFYYDAGNYPGIALGQVSNASWRTGCVNGRSIVETTDVTLFLAQSAGSDTGGGRSIIRVDGLSLTTITTPYIERVLNRSSLAGMTAFSLKISGHSFYILTLQDLNFTLVYDLLLDDWQLWSSVVGGVEQYFVYRNPVSTSTQDLLQDPTTGHVVALSMTSCIDTTGPINVRVVTIPYTWGTLKRKQIAACFLDADTVVTTVQLRYSDDDYVTFSSFGAINCSTVRKMLQRLGSTRRRSFELLHTDNTPLRMYSLEFDIHVCFS